MDESSSISDKSNSDDNPTWDEAMNGTRKEGYWLTYEKEINTLNKKHAWEVVDQEDWMNVIPSTWDFKKNVTHMEASTN